LEKQKENAACHARTPLPPLLRTPSCPQSSCTFSSNLGEEKEGKGEEEKRRRRGGKKAAQEDIVDQ
jgi:hypothetical protein